ncbi:hypothetical protein TWF281_011268 [Arthrobotrys megalospora]
MSTQKRVLVPASPENILQSHVGVIVIILCGVAALLATLGICMYSYVKFRRARRRKLEKENDHERLKDSIIHLTKVNTDGTSGSRGSDETLPRRPASFGNDYGMIGFGNCRTSYMESITGSGHGVLPGDVVLPENGASTARNIRDTSAVLTPPMTPDKCKLPSIQHWTQPLEGYPGPTEPLRIGGAPFEVPIPPPLTISKKNVEKELPNVPLSRGRRIQRWDEIDQPLFGTVKRASMRRRARSRNLLDRPRSKSRQGVETSSLRKFGELEARRGRKGRYRNRKSADGKILEGLPFSESPSYETVQLGSETAVEVVQTDEVEKTEGYRASLISAYDRDSTDDSSDYGESESYLWKPLPKPPVESNWPSGRAEMP